MSKTYNFSKKRNILMTLIGSLIALLFGMLLIFNITIIVKGTMNPDRPPSIFGMTPLVVLSGSMSGSQDGHIEVGDLVLVRNIAPQELEAGDVIAFMNGQTTVTHRITKVNVSSNQEISFNTKGDANNSEDASTVAASQVIGIYVCRIPKIGDFVFFLQKPAGMFIFIGVPLLLFIGYDLFYRQKKANKEQKKLEAMKEELQRLKEDNKQK